MTNFEDGEWALGAPPTRLSNTSGGIESPLIIPDKDELGIQFWSAHTRDGRAIMISEEEDEIHAKISHPTGVYDAYYTIDGTLDNLRIYPCGMVYYYIESIIGNHIPEPWMEEMQIQMEETVLELSISPFEKMIYVFGDDPEAESLTDDIRMKQDDAVFSAHLQDLPHGISVIIESSPDLLSISLRKDTIGLRVDFKRNIPEWNTFFEIPSEKNALLQLNAITAHS